MFSKMNRNMLRLIKKPPQLAYKLGLGRFLGRKVLLLTTIGRKSGLPRVTPLQYEIINDQIQVSSAMGERTDWMKNIKVNPQISVELGRKKFKATAETSTDPGLFADYVFHKLSNHPLMTRLIFLFDGIPWNPTREFILDYGKDKAMLFIHPD